MDERHEPVQALADSGTDSGSGPGRIRRRRLPAGTFAVGLLGVLWITGCMERLFYYPDAGPTPPPGEPPDSVQWPWLGS